MLTIRDIVIDDYSIDNILDVLFKNAHKKKQADVVEHIYRSHHKQKFKKLKLTNLLKTENISQEDLKEIKRLSDLTCSTLKKLAQLRNIKTTGLTKSDLICILLRSQKHHDEKKDLEYLQSDPVNEIKSEINGIRKYIIELGMMIDKSDKDKIRKRLDEIDKKTRINRTEKKILLEELSKISIDLQYKRKRIGSAYDSDDYYGLRDLEYTFGDLDDHCKLILAKENFNGNYQMYTCREDKNGDMDIDMYPDKVRPYLITLIDEKKLSEQKIKLDIAINLRHITKNNRITFYVKSKNITCLLSDNSEDILEQLINSLRNYYEDKLLLCRTDSSYVYESVEGLSIHFHKIDLNRGSSYIPPPDWLKNKGATINPQNTKDSNCFMYALTISLNHEKIGKTQAAYQGGSMNAFLSTIGTI